MGIYQNSNSVSGNGNSVSQAISSVNPGNSGKTLSLTIIVALCILVAYIFRQYMKQRHQHPRRTNTLDVWPNPDSQKQQKATQYRDLPSDEDEAIEEILTQLTSDTRSSSSPAANDIESDSGIRTWRMSCIPTTIVREGFPAVEINEDNMLEELFDNAERLKLQSLARARPDQQRDSEGLTATVLTEDNQTPQLSDQYKNSTITPIHIELVNLPAEESRQGSNGQSPSDFTDGSVSPVSQFGPNLGSQLLNKP